MLPGFRFLQTKQNNMDPKVENPPPYSTVPSPYSTVPPPTQGESSYLFNTIFKPFLASLEGGGYCTETCRCNSQMGRWCTKRPTFFFFSIQ